MAALEALPILKWLPGSSRPITGRWEDPSQVFRLLRGPFSEPLQLLPCRFIDEEKAKSDPSYYLKNTNAETRETLSELYKEFKGDDVLAATMKAPEKKKVDKLNAVS